MGLELAVSWAVTGAMGTIALALRVKSRLRPQTIALRPVLRFHLVVVEVHNHSLTCFDIHGARPDGVSVARHCHVVVTRLYEQTLMPDPIPVEFIDVADKVIWSRPVHRTAARG